MGSPGGKANVSLQSLIKSSLVVEPFNKFCSTTLAIKTSQYGYGRVMRRVVVTGLGAITPLGVGFKQTWSRLLNAESGIVSVAKFEPQRRWKDLTSTVVGIVPKASSGATTGKDKGLWHPDDWLTATEQRRMSLFAQYASAAAEMALEDASWKPTIQSDLEATGVCIGSGIGNLEELFDTALAFEESVSR